MRRAKSWAVVCALLGAVALIPACDAGGIGDPCIPEDEYSDTFSGFALTEVNTESRSFQCRSRLCLVNHFQGRVSCPYGQSAEQAANNPACLLPGSIDPVRAAVKPQLLARRTDDAVYCSCRCAGPDPDARYCDCPSGFSCSPVVPDFGVGEAQLPGSYCVRADTEYTPVKIGPETCDPALANCPVE
jgi:hypothetical protein